MIIKSKFICIHEFMVRDIGLKGNAIFLFALLYNYTKNGGWFTGSLKYMAKRCGATIQGIQNTLKALLEKNLIIKETITTERGLVCQYKINLQELKALNVSEKGSFILIHDFMVTELGLKGNNLLVHALIYGYTKDSDKWFTGGQEYIAKCCNSTVQGIQKNLKHLIGKGLLIRTAVRTKNGTYCRYMVNQDVLKDTDTNKFAWGDQQICKPDEAYNNDNQYGTPSGYHYDGKHEHFCTPPYKFGCDPIQICWYNNKIYNKYNNKESLSIYTDTKKKTFGKYNWIKLTDEEYTSLVSEYSENEVMKKIDYIDEYCQMNNNKYNYHDWNLVIKKAISNNWGEKCARFKKSSYKNEKRATTTNRKPSYSIKEFEKMSIFANENEEIATTTNRKASYSIEEYEKLSIFANETV